MQNLVSILIPMYNAAETITRALQSCLAQSHPDVEILVLDDASSDASAAIVREFGNPKIRIYQNVVNAGIAAARNTLLSHAQGEYIAWLDADDVMSEDRIEEQVLFMQQHPDIDIAGSWILTDDHFLPYKKVPLLHEQIKAMLWFRNCMFQPSVISRNFYKQENIWYDMTFNQIAEDYELWYRLCGKKRFANIPLFLTTYHMLTGDALEKKLLHNNFKNNLDRLWEHKWRDMPVEVAAVDRTHFRHFLYSANALENHEAESVNKTLNKLAGIKQDDFFMLLIAYHRLRLWKHMPVPLKIRNIGLLGNAVYYRKIKRSYIL